MGQLDPLARLLFIGLWTLADCEGRLEERPKRIQAQVLPYDTCDVDRFLEELEELGFIQRYEARGRKVIQIVNFTKHQHPHFKESKYDLPAPPEPGALDKPGASPRQAQGKPEASRVVNGELYMGNGEWREEARAREKPPAKDATRASSCNSSLQPIGEDFLSELQAKPAYQLIEVRHVYAKMKAWCEVKGHEPTRERLLKWLNREEPPKAGSIRPVTKKPFDPGRSAPQPERAKPVDVETALRYADDLEQMGRSDVAQQIRDGLKPQ